MFRPIVTLYWLPRKTKKKIKKRWTNFFKGKARATAAEIESDGGAQGHWLQQSNKAKHSTQGLA